MNIQGSLPGITAPLQAQNATSAAAAGGTGGTSGSSGANLSPASLQETFLNLLATELQNQDPTAPVDPTQMVGQLVSLNQLDQLISINSTLSSLAAPPTGTSASAQVATAAPLGVSDFGATSGATSSSSSSNSNSTPSALAALSQLTPSSAVAAGSNALMNLYSNITAPAHTSKLSFNGGR